MTYSCRDKPSIMGQAEWGAQRRQQAASDFPGELGPGPHRTQTSPPPRPASPHCTAQTPGASGFLMLCGPGTRGSVHKQRFGEREGQPDREVKRRKRSLTCIYSLPHLPLPSPFPCPPPPPPVQQQQGSEGMDRAAKGPAPQGPCQTPARTHLQAAARDVVPASRSSCFMPGPRVGSLEPQPR